MADRNFGGIAETSATYDNSLKLIGTQTEGGETVAISYFKWTSMDIIPLAIRISLFVLLSLTIFVRHPFGWLPVKDWSEWEWLIDLKNWEIFSGLSYAAAMIVFAFYVVASYALKRYYVGVPGTEIHFTRHKKIVDTIKPGRAAFKLDPWVKPYAVVTTKPFPVEMPEIAGDTSNQIDMKFRSALILRVADTYRLLEQGGFQKFFAQLNKLYESTIKDLIKGHNAKDFNSFLIEPIAELAKTASQNDDNRSLDELGKSDLNVKMITELSEISELDISRIPLGESVSVLRDRIIQNLSGLAQNYGIEIMNCLPLGNTTADKYLESLALPLISAIARLKQSAEVLKSIKEEEIDETIKASVADKELGVLEVTKIIKEIGAITEALCNGENKNSIVSAKVVAMENAAKGLIEPLKAKIESLIAQVEGKSIDTAGHERYIQEMESIMAELKRNLRDYVPAIEDMVVENCGDGKLLPQVDVIDKLLENTGTTQALEKLKKDMAERNEKALEDSIQVIEKEAEKVNIDEILSQICKKLEAVATGSGISIDAFAPEKVKDRLDAIARRANVDIKIDEESAVA